MYLYNSFYNSETLWFASVLLTLCQCISRAILEVPSIACDKHKIDKIVYLEML